MNGSGVVFVLSFLATVYFIRAAIRAWRGPEMQRDLARLRERRRPTDPVRRIAITRETFAVVEARAGFLFDPATFVDDGGSSVSFAVSEETVERLEAISPDPDSALLILLAHGRC
jgi:hypothetical protein